MGPYKFSYVGKQGNLIPELTLKQNLLLDYTGESLSEEKEVHFKKNLKELPNVQMETIYNMIIALSEFPKNATSEEIKLISLLKALLSNSPYIFLECPEEELSEKSFHKFQEALFNQIQTSKQTVFLITKKENNWSKYISKIITRNKDLTFNTESFDPKVEFLLEKKAFYDTYSKEKANQSVLRFKIPKKKTVA
jgi:ABC-type lipoprotein export system ATPase subunit